jgi:hypothetical protein
MDWWAGRCRRDLPKSDDAVADASNSCVADDVRLGFVDKACPVIPSFLNGSNVFVCKTTGVVVAERNPSTGCPHHQTVRIVAVNINLVIPGGGYGNEDDRWRLFTV